MSNKVRDFTNIRVFFSKTGNAKYISHLDLYRSFGRVIKRAKLPVWITEGFNPHIYVTFALPLALGIESCEESMDLRLIDDSELCALPTEKAGCFASVAEKLNAVMPRGLVITRVAEPIRKANEISRAVYEVKCASETLEAINTFLSQPKIEIEKRTKKNFQVIDVKPLLEWENGMLTLPAGSTLNINPWNVLSGFDDINVKRIKILCEDGGAFI